MTPSWGKQDLGGWWLPFTADRAFKARPRLVAGASGMFVKNERGDRVLDASAGLRGVNAGHGRPELAGAVHEAMLTLGSAPPFHMGHAAGFELARELIKLLPSGFSKVFFANSGSEAVDTALKLAFAFHHLRGEPARARLVAREGGFHGAGFGGTSVGGVRANRLRFGPLLPGVDHLPAAMAGKRFLRGVRPADPGLVEGLERIISVHGAGSVAAVILEPVMTMAGVHPPPDGGLKALREVTRKHGILLIFDEAVTGFGRAGGFAFAAQAFGVTPDILVMGCGLANGAVPMGAAAATGEVCDAFSRVEPGGIEFPHGYTTSGHPAACAAALATLGVLRKEGLVKRGGGLAPAFEDALFSLAGRPGVRDVRVYGLLGAVELEPEATPGAAGLKAFEAAWRAGLLAAVQGDTLLFAPALIVEEDHLARIRRALAEALGPQLGW